MTVEAPKPESRNPKPRGRKSGVIVPHQPLWYHRLGAWIIFLALRTLMLTLHYTWNDRAGMLQKPMTGPVIFAIWHNRLALCMKPYDVYRKKSKGMGMAAMCSASKDGAFLAGILECFKIQPVRGSSSRRGPQALLELTSWADRGYDLAITPDGPRGPRYVVQEGVMSLAQLTGLPIVPFSFNLRWKIQLKSWDHFQIPLPFSKCELNAGAPIHVPREATDAEREQLRQRVETALKELSRD
ncbi:MAG: lysophospholipid acyltransferase family protein [Akkermansiaceae bacterium]|nr:lysophospholipid acyltransferase family protein [Verrucomicrobiales bacterium]